MTKYSGKLKFIAWALPALLITLAIATCAGCRTVKYVEKEKVVVDSSVIEQNEGLQAVLQETIERYEKILETASKTGIVFDTVYRDTGSLKVVNKVTFDNGRIKTIEGRILAVNHDLQERTGELYDAHATIDSMAVELERKDAQLSKKVDVVTKEVMKTRWPWWLFVLCLLGGAFLQYKFRPVEFVRNLITKKPPG